MAHPSSTSSSEATPQAKAEARFQGFGRRTLRATLYACVAFVVIDIACRLLLPRGDMEGEFHLIRDRVTRDPAPNIEIVGDSVARGGLLEGSLAEANVTVRNDALGGASPPFTYLLLRSQFQAGHRPDAIVIAHSPHTFADVRIPVLVGAFARWSELPEMFRTADKWTDVLYGILTKLSYILMYRDNFQDLTAGKYEFFRHEIVAARPTEQERLDRYRERSARNFFAQNRLPTSALPDRYSKPFEVSAENDRYFRKILELAKSHDVPVYWLTMPVPARVEAARATVNYERDMLAYVKGLEKSEGLREIQGEFVVYDDRLFTDLSHLNAAGAIKFACDLRDLRQRTPDAGRNPTAAASAEGARKERQLVRDGHALQELIGMCGELRDHSAAATLTSSAQ